MKRRQAIMRLALVLLAAVVLLGTAVAQYDQGPPPNNQQYPQQGGYPPQDQGAYPQQQYPPQQGGYPDQGGYEQQQQYPPQQGGYPQQNPYPEQNQQPQQDPSSRVVRLKYLSGSVSMQPGGVNDWVQAVLNRPLTTSDRIWTDRDSRAELALDSGMLRMNGETSVTFTNVSDNTTQIELDQGVFEVSVYRLYPGEIYEIDTPNLAFTITKPGEYRFDVLSDADETWVTVRHGEGMATGQGPGLKVSYGQQVRFFRGNSMQHDRRHAPDRDGFDDWCQVRDKREQNGAYTRYVPPGTIGAEDLDQYGYWRVMPQYGPVWFPQVAPGWAPYQYGHWVWIDPWGWTWVDNAPWGFAPFHYGRWAYVGGGWGWCPGPYYGGGWGYARPVYAPALVAWVGGSNWGIGIGVGPAVGWFPLGWREPYYPAYRVSNVYVRNVNVTNTRIVNVTNIVNNYNTHNVTNITYVNRNVPGAVAAMRQDDMIHARSVDRHMVRVDQTHLREARLMERPGIAPDRASVLGIHAGERSAVPPRQAVSRPVVRQITPPPVAHRTVFAGDTDRRGPGMGTGNVPPRGPANSNVTPPRQAPPMAPTTNAPGQGRGNVANEDMRGRGNSANAPGHGNVANEDMRGRGNSANAPGHSNVDNDNAPGRPSHNVPRPPSAGGAPVTTQGGVNVAPTSPSSNRRTVYTNDNISTPRTGPEGTPRGTVAPENPRPSAPPVQNAPATVNRPEVPQRAPQASEAPRNMPAQAPARAPQEARPGQGQGGGREVHRPAEGNKPKQEPRPKESEKPRDNRSSLYGNDGAYAARTQSAPADGSYQRNSGYAERGSYNAPARGAYASAPSYGGRGAAASAPSYGGRGGYSPAAHSGGGARSAPAVRSTPSNNGGRGGNSHENGGSHRG